MTIEKALKDNPYNPQIGNISAYIRYLRYNVDGFYEKDSKEVRQILEQLHILDNCNKTIGTDE